MLAPEIQEEVLLAGSALTLRELLALAHMTAWKHQRGAWKRCATEGDRQAA
jgi:hypothetical protein